MIYASDDRSGQIMWAAVWTVCVLVLTAWMLASWNECEARGGVFVQDAWGWPACVEKR